MEPFPELPQEPLPEPRRISFAPLIIAAVAFTLVVVIVASNLQEEPVFEKIDTLTIHFLSNRGLTQKPIAPPEQRDMIRCLENNTRRLEKADLEKELLPSTYLIELHNGSGRNSIELISRNNLADNRGYYFNDCIHALIEN